MVRAKLTPFVAAAQSALIVLFQASLYSDFVQPPSARLYWQFAVVVASAVAGLVFQLVREYQRMRDSWQHDPLTGLPSRRLMQAPLSQALAEVPATGALTAVLVLDVDRFKTVNDSLGHGLGDRLLIAVAERLKAAVRKNDIVVRLGGDEFVVIAAGVRHTTEVARLADSVLAAIAQPLLLAGRTLHPTASIGIAMVPADGDDEHSLIRNAGTAMARAKAAGGGGFQFFDASMNARAIERLDLEGKLRQALAEKQFELYYQPKVGLQDDTHPQVEALIRWRHPALGLVSPTIFIPLAEESGLILAIGEWVLREACGQIGRWWRAGLKPPVVAVNLSARQFQDERLVEKIEAILAETGTPPQLIEIEVTESWVISDPARAIATLQRIRALGMGVALDDFGTGYSSLAHLKRLPISSLKIDQSFVADLGGSRADTAIVQAIVTLARILGLEVVAEGVETAEQAAALKTAGCHIGQGYFFAKPLAEPEASAWLARQAGLAVA